uniref:Uncharacterized protein n=1 Tax=Chromera velia CCMP2878 TaxID=1169474 RepID=A0A0G4H8M6_9ALVE|eukprot:Cvel_25166.t1-p1 / transcript=Cvel_25166.t1 / gene=Cvel_25166 / organism=Chromera_velia_CCMP2878 / gene_product=hypothetical protein / transcript_product=hypothetical protein / location=Cvel_scaffold2816:7169-7453(-) / protein_length=95 / sequence_SO=supercontig / SO=protein_coding / is_pseudo=false
MLYEMGPAPQIVYLMTEDGGHEMQVTALLTAGIPIQLVTKKQGCGLCGLSKTGAQYITLDFVREFLPNRKKRPLHEAIVPAPKKPFCLFCAAIEH